MSRRLLSTSLSLALVAAPLVAHADDPVAAYRDAVAHASAAFDAGDYATARAGFEAAYAIHAAPVLLFDIASCYRREGDLADALDRYRAFLVAASSDDPQRALASQTIADLEAQQTPAPPPAPIPAPPPAHLSVSEPPSLPASQPPSRSSYFHYAGLTAVGLSVITGSLALLAARDASADTDLLNNLPDHQHWNGNEQAAYDDGVAASHRGVVLGITTAVLASSGVALYLWGEHLAHRATLTAAPTGDGAVVSLTYR